MPSPSDLTPWPAAEAEAYRALGYWTGETFGELLTARAAATPDAIAVVDDRNRWTYGELETRATSLAAGFLEHGIRPGDRVLVQLPNIAEFVEIIFGLFHAGALPVFCLPAHRQSELVPIAQASGAVAMVTCHHHQAFDHAALAATLRDKAPDLRHLIIVADRPGAEVPEGMHALDELRSGPRELPTVRASDIAFLQLSGGSTGTPKLIPRTHDDYLYSVRRSAELCGLDSDSVYLAALPVAHNFPMSSPGILGALYAGGTVALAADPTPSTAFSAIERFSVTITGLVPPLARLWVERAEAGATQDISSLQVLLVGGARCPDELARRIGPALGVTLQQVFGMAEGLVCYTRLDDPAEVVLATQGRPMSEHDQVAVVDEDGEPVPPGTDGLLITKGPYTIRGYYRNPEANASSFTEDGWYRTGDVVNLRADGNLVVKGRLGDRVNRGGEKISAEEIEAHLLDHPLIRDAIVVSVPDERLGERSCVFVLAADPASPPALAQIRQFVRERGVATWKIPDLLQVVDSFPETGVGKISRRSLRAELSARAAADS
ncbi:2,3-dihydroxybenzoate-AMP ligase [Nocardia tenerifensis]|uniref:2,3-dihydroxybenzoate-AMP ligase n=1 Tax=Nocardia tenerifensis TaxID=228006 RepID=A0A318K896_9NOCA|nr:AMP-binding protein [Nocardia tenerifensis]PXX69335.1 2,3-dihydroxybenzoate-AMP ligase [Nocardia tenerifensis]